MADGTLDSELFYLFDLLPGIPDVRLSPPKDGFAGTDHHNVVGAVYNIGTKIQVYNRDTGVDGPSILVYGKLEMQDAVNVLAARHWCVWHSDATPFDFTNEVASDLGASTSGMVAGLGAMTVDYFGWFWCGGVCPESFVSDLGGNYYTTNDVAIGTFTHADLGTPGTTAGEIGMDLPDADTEPICGLANTADTDL